VHLHRPLAAALGAALLVPLTAGAAAAQDGPSVSPHVVTSFDGTPLEATLFLPPGASDEAPVPLILRTHGWGGTGEREVGSGTLARLLDEGYAVLTWDQRGFGCSGGTVRIDDPDVEGRDVSALLDWVVDNAPIAEVDGDPVVGMTGGSYAGGIQTAAAAVDDRLDALAPEISWSDLRYSLYAGEVVNQGWVALLYGLGKLTSEGLGLSPDCASGPHTGGLDPAIDRGVTEFLTTGSIAPDTLDFFAKSSLASYGADRPVTVPTLVLQGSVDTLFDLTDGYGVYEHVRDQGVEARFVAFCGGHVACPDRYVDAGDRAHLDDAIVTWFDRHLRGEDVGTGAPIEYRTNEGVWRSATDYPLPASEPVPLRGEARDLAVVPIVDVPDVAGLADLVAAPDGIPALPITSAVPTVDGDPRGATFPVAVAADGPLEIVGIPDVSLTVSGTTAPLDEVLGPLSAALADSGALEEVSGLLVGSLRPFDGIVDGLGGATALGGVATPSAHVFVKLIHREAGEVLNLQEGAISVDLSGGEVTVDVPMPGLAYTLPEGHHLDVQVATNSLMHATGRVPAIIDVTLDGSLPAVGTVVLPDTSDDEEAEEALPTPDLPLPDDALPAAPLPDDGVPGDDTAGDATATPVAAAGADVTVRTAAAAGQLPATGSGVGALALLALAGGLWLARRPSTG
jgi:ABC-2 type transport system ATP-binding protein